MTQHWQPDRYRDHAGFVPALGGPVLDLLAPRSGERILDVGCGDGALTESLAATGAVVVGIDGSAAMIEAARRRGLDARVMDASALTFDSEFDAVFSNAALHWVLDAEAAVSGISRALEPGGRFVAELGGLGNIAAIATALRAVLSTRGVDLSSPWYFPTLEAYTALLERSGLIVEEGALIPRPTPLPTGMAGWLDTFGGPYLGRLPAGDREAARDEAVALLAPSLCDTEGAWTADYVRLRVRAVKAA